MITNVGLFGLAYYTVKPPQFGFPRVNTNIGILHGKIPMRLPTQVLNTRSMTQNTTHSTKYFVS